METTLQVNSNFDAEVYIAFIDDISRIDIQKRWCLRIIDKNNRALCPKTCFRLPARQYAEYLRIHFWVAGSFRMASQKECQHAHRL